MDDFTANLAMYDRYYEVISLKKPQYLGITVV
jgi:hypothetical protein